MMEQRLLKDFFVSQQIKRRVMVKIKGSRFLFCKSYIIIDFDLFQRMKDSQVDALLSGDRSALQINIRLLNKYSTKFSFFESKSINQIIYDLPQSITNIDFRDASVLSEDQQRMRRTYRHETKYGRPQINDKLAILTQFYTRALVMRYEYPNLVILKSFKEDYVRRLRRLRKMIASDASSDCDDESCYGKYNNSFTSLFLKQNSEESIIHNNRINFDYQIEYEQKIHNIYNPQLNQLKQDNNQQKQSAFSQSFIEVLTNSIHDVKCQELCFNFNFSQDQIGHLWCDFNDIDTELVEKQYSQIQARKKNVINEKQNQSLQILKKQSQNSKNSKESNNHLQKFFKKTNNDISHHNKIKKQALIQDSLDPKSISSKDRITSTSDEIWKNIPISNSIYRVKEDQIYKNKDNNENPKISEEQSKELSNKYKAVTNGYKKESLSKKQKKQKIRDKATALLNRVKNLDDYMQRSYNQSQIKDQEGSTTVAIKTKLGTNQEQNSIKQEKKTPLP